FDANVLLDGSAQDRLEARHHVAQVNPPKFEHLLASERQQLSGEHLEVLGGALDLFHHLLRCRIESAEKQKLAVAENGREQVVEVVRDTAREEANALHLLCLPELLV